MEFESDFEEVLVYINSCVQEHQGHPLSDVESNILRYSWQGLSYGAMAKRMGYAVGTLRGVYGFKLWPLIQGALSISEKFNKARFKQVVERHYRVWRQGQSSGSSASTVASSTVASPLEFDNSSETELLNRLANTLNAGCNSLILTGAKGIGKSCLLKALEPKLNGHFSQIIHHSIHEVPTWYTWHQKIFPKTYTDQAVTEPSLSEHQARQQVLQALNKKSYLMVIDQGERFLENPKHNDFIKEITTIANHQSCFLWSGSVRPNDIDRHHVPIETLEGRSFDEAQTLLLDSYPHLANSLTQKEHHWKQLNELCGGNPTLLHKSVEAIQSFYDNQIEHFYPLPLPPPLSKYFDDLFADLSISEQTLLYWLALQPLSWRELTKWPLFLPFNEGELMQAWYMLQRRHFIKRAPSTESLWQITPQYLGLYLIGKLQEIFIQELSEEKLNLFHSHPIAVFNTSLEQQNALQKYLLAPIANHLRKKFSQNDLKAKIIRLFSQSKAFCKPSHSCAAGSLFNLCAYLGIPMANIDLSGLTLWHVDLSRASVKGIDFKGCQLKSIALATGLQEQVVTALHPTGKAMATGDRQGLLQVYAWTGRRFVLSWCYELDFPIQEITITDNDKLIVSAIDQLKIWETFTSKENVYSAQLEAATIETVAVRADGDLLATGLSDGSIQLWDLAWVEQLGEPLYGAYDNIKHLVFSPDGEAIAGYDNNNRVLVWHQDSVTDTYTAAEVQFPLNPYGHFLTFKWIDEQHLSVIEAVPEINDQEDLAKIDIRTFMVEKETLADDSMHHDVKALPYPAGQPQQAAFSNDGTYLTVCDIEHKVQIWNNMKSVRERSIRLPNLPYALNICNGGRILLCQESTKLSLWDLSQQQCLQVWEPVSDPDQYGDCKFYENQGLSNDELMIVQRLGAILCQE